MAGGCIGICDFPEVEQLVPEKLPSQKDRMIFQPSFFRGELLNFKGVNLCGVSLGGGFKHFLFSPVFGEMIQFD